MPDIPTSGTPTNINTNSTPLFQEWGSDPVDITINHVQGQPVPPARVLLTKFKDIVGTAAAVGYTALNYRTYMSVIPAYPNCIQLSGPLYTTATGQAPYQNGIQGEMTYTFINFNLLNPGIYTFHTYHQIRGTNSAGEMKLIDEYLVRVLIRVFSTTDPTFTPSSGFDFIWTIGQTNTIVKPFTISGASWVIHVRKGFTIAPAAGVVISELSDGGYTAEGTGAKSLGLIALPSVEPETITVNPLTSVLSINDFTLQFPITVTFVNESGLFQSVTQMNFFGYKGIENAKPQTISTHYPGNYKFISPPWANVLPASGSLLLKPVVSVLPADNMEEGVYTGKIEIRTITGNTLVGSIDITYSVVGKLKSPYLPGVPAFTLDRKFFELSSQMDNTYYDVVMKVTSFDFFTNVEKESTIPFKVPLFKRKQTLNIGQTIDRIMSSIPDMIHKSGIQYRRAEVSLDFTEKSFIDKTYANAYSISDLSFIAGLEPILVGGNAFLEINPAPSRVTPNSIYYLNMFVPRFYSLEVLKNGEPYDSPLGLNVFSGLGIRSSKLDFSIMGAKPGDIFEYKLYLGSFSTSKIFKVFPEGYYSNHIVWENEYKLLSRMEFTGKYTLKTDIDNKTTSINEKLVDVLRKFKSTKTSKLVINTGFILKSDIASVENLCTAKRAALILPDSVIDLVPVQKTIVSVDNERGLISFEVEFEINRKFNEEIYSF